MAEKQDIHNEDGTNDSELLDGIHYTGNKGPCLGARHVMVIMIALGSSITFATKGVFSVIIVAMTTSNTSSNTELPTYNWDNKGVILSSAIWLGIPIQLIAGHLGKEYGHKWLILGSVVVNTVFFMLIPLFASLWDSTGVIFCRIIEGGAIGILHPVVQGVHGIWVPVEERAKLGMIQIVCGFLASMGAIVGSGQIVASYWGYPGCIYLIGVVNFIWCVAWIFLGFQSPATHPRITPEERQYIETSLSLKKTQYIPTPWLKLLTSLHFWAPVVAAIGVTWVDTIMSTVNMIYITQAWKIDIATGTSTVAIGPIVAVACGIFLAPLSDFLIKKKVLRIVNARRLYHTVGIVGNSLCLLWMTWIEAGSMGWIILNLCIGNIFMIAFSVGGSSLNILDIAPSFAGIIGGFASTVAQCFALFAPMTIDWFVTDESDRDQWRIIFLITGVITVGTAIFFDIFASDKRKWDNPDDENSKA